MLFFLTKKCLRAKSLQVSLETNPNADKNNRRDERNRCNPISHGADKWHATVETIDNR